MAHAQKTFLFLNASFNLTTVIFLLAGFSSIRAKKQKLHIFCISFALLFSFLFLLSYLYTHFTFGILHFQGDGSVRLLYFFLLISHTLLATLLVPLVILTLLPTMRRNFPRHVQFARFTLPLWLYVSFSGVLVYLFLLRTTLLQ